ncbi:hypothetical protein PR048_013927 [Dryococelus australis]|uniref:CHK kinase-like domain-containing protein n=1 Tax=Dryococelus australis TaxID=614101 RepID=A0ABQ9HUH1_9NEOP|nr:hypothetical protein PR048_013927 [Dryococelus australis]
MNNTREADWVLVAIRRHLDRRGVTYADLQVRQLSTVGLILSKIYLAEWIVGSRQLQSVVCKLTEDEPFKTAFRVLMHFHNENFFFAELLPCLLGPASVQNDVSLLFPLFHFAHRDDLQWLIAMEDLTALDYKNVHKTLDLRHTTLALQALGRFHALSYVAKKTQPAQFHSLIGRLQYPRKEKSFNFTLELLILNSLRHTISLFREAHPGEYAKHSAQIEEIISDATEVYGRLYTGSEPLALLCHGDFKSENLLFSYDGEENPSTVKLIDFQLLSYSSPAIDVFLLLFMSTAPEIWETFWDTLFSSYHEALLETVSKYNKCSLESLQEELGAEAFKTEFRKYCHHGFYVSNFFQPLRNCEPELNALIIKTLAEDEISQTKLNNLLVNMNNNYSAEMKHYALTLLQQVLVFKCMP